MVNFQLNIWSFFDQFSVEFNTCLAFHQKAILVRAMLEKLLCVIVMKNTSVQRLKKKRLTNVVKSI